MPKMPKMPKMPDIGGIVNGAVGGLDLDVTDTQRWPEGTTTRVDEKRDQYGNVVQRTTTTVTRKGGNVSTTVESKGTGETKVRRVRKR